MITTTASAQVIRHNERKKEVQFMSRRYFELPWRLLLCIMVSWSLSDPNVFPPYLIYPPTQNARFRIANMTQASRVSSQLGTNIANAS